MLLSLFSKVRLGDSDLRDVILGSGITLAIKVLGALLSFFVAVLLSRSLGGHGVGIYFIAFAILNLSTNIARFGLDNAIIKYVSSAYLEKDWPTIFGLYRHAILWVILSTCLISITLYFSANFLAHQIFHTAELELILKYLGLAILPFALFNIYAAFFQAMGAVINSVISYAVIVPLLMIVGISLLTWGEFNSAENMIFLYGFNCLINLLICHFIFLKLTKIQQSGHFSSSLLLSTCIPLFWTVLAECIAVQAPQLILGSYWPPEDVAVFSICLRIATLISFILTSASRVIAPKLAILHSKSDTVGLARLATITTTVMLAIACFLSIGIIIFSEQLLSLFGSSFVVGKTILQLLALSQLILIINGLGKIVLQMTGYERLCKNITILNVILLLLFCMLLIPTYASLGAVFSLLVTAIITTIITVIFIKKELDFYLVGFEWLHQARNIKS